MKPRFHSIAVIATLTAHAGLAASASAEPRVALQFTGVNIAGAEFGGKKIPGKPGTDYFYPLPATIDYFAAKGMNTLRIPFRWERMQRALETELDAGELKRLDAVVEQATGRGMNVVLDVHNYAAYGERPIGTPEVPVPALGDLWRRLAERYKGNERVIFGLMNEPKSLPTETWLQAANAAIAAIRQAGARNLILVPGNGWTGAHSWMSRGYGTPNAEVMLGVVDPANHYAYEVHQYLDGNYSGTRPNCKSEQIGVTTLQKFTQWLRDHRKRGFLGEFGGGTDPTCLAALDAMLTFMNMNSDVWLGWTYWAAGPWPQSYFTSVQPVNGADRPQMSILLKHVAPRGGQISN
ncbi:MAG TPA: glycoside hydrolase family 5 protein [Pirellulales bacterium]|jgi:endoglucanase|nr:glycoside hydrolase family 5 protein [Pirellulales bacterium]